MAKAKIGLYEIWLINGVGLAIVAFLNCGMISNQTEKDKRTEINIANKNEFTYLSI